MSDRQHISSFSVMNDEQTGYKFQQCNAPLLQLVTIDIWHHERNYK
jgi:hypothetical protein